jgi:hypothetical protein
VEKHFLGDFYKYRSNSCHFIITFSIGEASLAEICALFEKFYQSLFGIVSCDYFSWILDEGARCYLSWRLFLAFMVEFSWLEEVYLVNAWTR